MLDEDDLWELRSFGLDAHEERYHGILEGGFIAPGREPPLSSSPGEEIDPYGARQEAGPTAGSRQRPQAEAAASRSSAHPCWSELNDELGLGELREYHPHATMIDGSPGLAFLTIPVGLFRSLPYRASLVMEIRTGRCG